MWGTYRVSSLLVAELLLGLICFLFPGDLLTCSEIKLTVTNPPELWKLQRRRSLCGLVSILSLSGSVFAMGCWIRIECCYALSLKILIISKSQFIGNTVCMELLICFTPASSFSAILGLRFFILFDIGLHSFEDVKGNAARNWKVYNSLTHFR